MSAAVRVALASIVEAPAIFPDELIYGELARSLGESFTFSVRGEPFPAWTYGPLYPLLLAPLYALLDTPDAYVATKVVNGVVMSLAAVPAYFLARRLLDQRFALLLAALAVLVPGMVYTTRVMTESLFYPVFLASVLAMFAALERPSHRRQVVALGAIALAFFCRGQALVLLPAFATAIVSFAALEARRDAAAPFLRALVRRVARYRVVWAATSVSLLLAAAAATVATGSPLGALGDHEVLFGRVDLASMPRWLLYHVAELDLLLGVVPTAAFVVVAASAVSRRSGDSRLLAFVALTASVAAWHLLLVGTYATQESGHRIHERYVFYVGPLFLVALLVWMRAGLPRPRPIAVAAAVVAGALPLAVLYASLVTSGVVANATGLIPWLLLRPLLDGALAVAVALICAAWAAAFLFVPGRRSGDLVGLVVVNLLVVTVSAYAAFAVHSAGALESGIGPADRDWIDRAVPAGARVAVISVGQENEPWPYRDVVEPEFFNRTIQDVYDLGTRWPPAAVLPSSPTRVRADGVVLADGRPLRAQYVLADRAVRVSGRIVSRNRATGQILFEVGGVVRARMVPRFRR